MEEVLDWLQRSETRNVCNLEEEEWWGVKIRNKIMKCREGAWLVGWLQRSEIGNACIVEEEE